MIFSLRLLPQQYAICQLPAQTTVPAWAMPDAENEQHQPSNCLISITSTADELSIVCPQQLVPPETTAIVNWRAFKIEGQLDFSLVGVVHQLSGLLAEQEISLFVISTFNTDYLLVQESHLPRAQQALTMAGHQLVS